MSILSERLRSARLDAGYSLEELASITKIGRASLQRYETGASEPTVEKIFELAKKLNVSPSYLFGIESKDLSDDDLKFLDNIFTYLNLDYIYISSKDFYYCVALEDEKEIGGIVLDSEELIENLYKFKKKYIIYPKDLKQIKQELISFGAFKVMSALKSSNSNDNNE